MWIFRCFFCIFCTFCLKSRQQQQQQHEMVNINSHNSLMWVRVKPKQKPTQSRKEIICVWCHHHHDWNHHRLQQHHVMNTIMIIISCLMNEPPLCFWLCLGYSTVQMPVKTSRRLSISLSASQPFIELSNSKTTKITPSDQITSMNSTSQPTNQPANPGSHQST